jgi:hypothetical protein
MAPSYDEEKFTELLVLVADKLRDDPAAGAIKLNKVLYFSEFGHVRSYGHPITGAVFQRLPMGPAPRGLRPVRAQLINEGAAELERLPFLGYGQNRLVPLRKPDLEQFSSEELISVDEAVTALAGLNGTDVSDLSRREMGWAIVKIGDDIPYGTAFLAPVSPPSSRAKQRARELSEQLPDHLRWSTA